MLHSKGASQQEATMMSAGLLSTRRRKVLALVLLVAIVGLGFTWGRSQYAGLAFSFISWQEGEETDRSETSNNGQAGAVKDLIDEQTRLDKGNKTVLNKYSNKPEAQFGDEPPGSHDNDDDDGDGDEDDGGDVDDPQNLDYEAAPRTYDGPYNEVKPGVKYFLYSPSGGFNNQREELAFAMEIARLLNRTLYVPMAGRHTSFFHAYEALKGPNDLFPMDRILDFPYMEEYGVKLVPLNTTVLRMAARFANQMGPHSVDIRFHPEAPSPIESWRLKDVLRFRSVTKSLLFIRGRGFYHRWFQPSVMTPVRKHARYSKYLRDLSMKIVEESIGREFYSMHVRLGDYKGKYESVSSFISGLVRIGWNHKWKTKSYPVYVATDDPRKSRDEFGPIYHSFSKIYFANDIPGTLVKEFRSLFPPKSKMKDDMMGILEQLICTQALDFVGSPGSTFSAWITFMRAMRAYTFPEMGPIDGNLKSIALKNGSSNSTETKDDNSQANDFDEDASSTDDA